MLFFTQKKKICWFSSDKIGTCFFSWENFFTFFFVTAIDLVINNELNQILIPVINKLMIIYWVYVLTKWAKSRFKIILRLGLEKVIFSTCGFYFIVFKNWKYIESNINPNSGKMSLNSQANSAWTNPLINFIQKSSFSLKSLQRRL